MFPAAAVAQQHPLSEPVVAHQQPLPSSDLCPATAIGKQHPFPSNCRFPAAADNQQLPMPSIVRCPTAVAQQLPLISH